MGGIVSWWSFVKSFREPAPKGLPQPCDKCSVIFEWLDRVTAKLIIRVCGASMIAFVIGMITIFINLK